jgi:hypothetical protein
LISFRTVGAALGGELLDLSKWWMF